MPEREQLLTKLSKLEAVERRWLWSVLASIILGAVLMAIAFTHLDLGAIFRSDPIRLPPTQFVIFAVGITIIVLSNLAVLVEYFAFELRVERAIVIKKRRGRKSNGGKDEDEAESGDDDEEP